MSGELFVGSNAEEWQGEFYERLAVVCTAAKLTVLEARSINACCRNLSLVQAGRLLGLTGSTKQIRGAMWHNLDRASGKLETFVYSRKCRIPQNQPSHQGTYVLKTVLDLMRSFVSKPTTPVYDARGTEVTLRTKVVIPGYVVTEGRAREDWLDELCVEIRAKLSKEKADGALVGS